LLIVYHVTLIFATPPCCHAAMPAALIASFLRSHAAAFAITLLATMLLPSTPPRCLGCLCYARSFYAVYLYMPCFYATLILSLFSRII